MSKRIGKNTVVFDNPPYIISTASAVGPKEAEGPLGADFDITVDDPMFGTESWEQAESAFVREGFLRAVEKAGLTMPEIDYIIGGDLLNQSIGTTFGIRGMSRPYLGIYGACSTFGEGLGIGSMLVDGSFANNIAVGASSHFCSAERQFRFPLSMGSQRPPTSSWTVTGHGAAIISNQGRSDVPRVCRYTAGTIVDMGLTDANNMGGAMAPAACDTIVRHLRDTGFTPDYYDLIVTGDLGSVGLKLLLDLTSAEGYDISSRALDCGVMIFDPETQDTHAGGSGCACAATVFSGRLYSKFLKGDIAKMLLIPTGAMFSTTSSQQGETIPCIAHAVGIEMKAE